MDYTHLYMVNWSQINMGLTALRTHHLTFNFTKQLEAETIRINKTQQYNNRGGKINKHKQKFKKN